MVIMLIPRNDGREQVSRVCEAKWKSRGDEGGMKAFHPNPGQMLKNYFEVPVEIIDEPERLVDWAQAAVGSAPSS